MHAGYTLDHSFRDCRELLNGISRALFAGSPIDVPAHVDGGVTSQFLKFLWRDIAVLDQEVDEGDPGGVEVELALGSVPWDASGLEIAVETPSRMRWNVQECSIRGPSLASSASERSLVQSGGLTGLGVVPQAMEKSEGQGLKPSLSVLRPTGLKVKATIVHVDVSKRQAA